MERRESVMTEAEGERRKNVMIEGEGESERGGTDTLPLR